MIFDIRTIADVKVWLERIATEFMNIDIDADSVTGRLVVLPDSDLNYDAASPTIKGSVVTLSINTDSQISEMTDLLFFQTGKKGDSMEF